MFAHVYVCWWVYLIMKNFLSHKRKRSHINASCMSGVSMEVRIHVHDTMSKTPYMTPHPTQRPTQPQYTDTGPASPVSLL